MAMETKSVLESKRSWFNYGSIIAIALTGILADEDLKQAIKEMFGAQGAIIMMVVGALVNQYLAQTSNKRPTFKLPEKHKPTKDNPVDQALRDEDETMGMY